MTNSGFVYTPAQVRKIDRFAIDRMGIPGFRLMGRAGQALFDDIRERYPAARQWLIVCGSGNNAGDGYVLAALAREAYLDVTVATLSDPAPLTGDAARAFEQFDRAGGETIRFDASLPGDPEIDLIVDAMLGTGLSRAVSGAYSEAIAAINAVSIPVVAADIPSGLDGVTGQPMGAAISADLTVTFVGLKQGMFCGQGPSICGEIRLHRLGIDGEAVAHVPAVMRVFGAAETQAILPDRAVDAHKGQFGHVLIIGGNHGMGGAARLAGEAALRAGAGLVSIACRPENAAAIVAARPELICRGVSTADDLGELLERASVVAIGPGLGTDAWASTLFDAAMAAGLPSVVDADALNLLADRSDRSDTWILTPHPGEAARLLNTDAPTVQRDRLAALDALCERYGGVTLLKGRGTLIGATNQQPYLITAGNPAMATAGMGDVLTGVVAGLLAQYSGDTRAVAAAAAFVHAAAGDAAAAGDVRGLMASDVLSALRPCLNPSKSD